VPSPFLSLLSEEGIHQTLRMMGPSPGECATGGSVIHQTSENLRDIYQKPIGFLTALGFSPRQQNVSAGVSLSGISVESSCI
jgi:hypothetical protein